MLINCALKTSDVSGERRTMKFLRRLFHLHDFEIKENIAVYELRQEIANADLYTDKSLVLSPMGCGYFMMRYERCLVRQCKFCGIFQVKSKNINNKGWKLINGIDPNAKQYILENCDDVGLLTVVDLDTPTDLELSNLEI